MLSVVAGQVSLTSGVPVGELACVAFRLAGVNGACASTAVVTMKSPLMLPMVRVVRVVVPGEEAEVTRTVMVSLGLMVPGCCQCQRLPTRIPK